ncbi:MAG TPA: SpoIIE family protein phosphatase [Bacteroidia bacterium]|nr:SpoIIE family protein phosphatase [Bacteroidia bacterium]
MLEFNIKNHTIIYFSRPYFYLSGIVFKTVLFLGILFTATLSLKAQKNRMDSINKILRSVPPLDTRTLCKSLLFKGELFKSIQTDTSIYVLKKLYNIAIIKNYIDYKSLSANQLEMVYFNNSILDSALNYGNIALKEAINSKLDSLKVNALINLAWCNAKMGDQDKAMPQFFEALTLAEKLGMKKNIERIYQLLGLIYVSKDKTLALSYFQKGLKLSFELNFERDIGLSYTRIGDTYLKMGKTDSARFFIDKSIKFSRERKNLMLEKWALEIDASLYSDLKNYTEALKIGLRSIEISKQIADSDGVMSSLLSVGGNYRRDGQYQKALKMLNEGLAMIKRNKQESLLSWAYLELKNTYKETGDFKNAFLASENRYEVAKKSMNEKSQTLIKEAEVKYKTLEKDKEIETQKSQLEKQEVESKQKEFQRNAFIVGFTFALLLVLFIWRGFKQKQKANTIIEKQKKLVEEKNKDITDSITYAKRIQEAILPSKEVKYKLFPEAFVLFQPRDIVSGDFYWFSEKNSKKIIAAADCTGHGVPGAFMSMIGNAFLNEIVNSNGITSPDQILNLLREQVITSLKQNDSDNKDGMDIALLSFDEKNNTVEFAGSNNPLWHIRNGVLMEIKADKQPIGLYKGDAKNFTNHKVELQKGDTLYIFTDGYADQFGGPKGKKFKYKQLQDILISSQKLSMQEQENLLVNNISEWKGAFEQVDDILIIGIRV